MHSLSLPSLVAEGGEDAAAACVALVSEALRSEEGCAAASSLLLPLLLLPLLPASGCMQQSAHPRLH